MESQSREDSQRVADPLSTAVPGHRDNHRNPDPLAAHASPVEEKTPRTLLRGGVGRKPIKMG